MAWRFLSGEAVKHLTLEFVRATYTAVQGLAGSSAGAMCAAVDARGAVYVEVTEEGPFWRKEVRPVLFVYVVLDIV